MTIEPMVSVKELRGGYDKRDVLKGVSLDVRRGEFLGIIGPNGSGKSTLLRLMSRALTPSGGSVSIEGMDMAGMDPKSLARRLAFVPQETSIDFAFSVWEIALMGRIPYLGRLQAETGKDISIVERALKATDTLSIRHKDINGLSAGERQRVVIAKAIAQEPVLLFLDEPTSHLDIGHQAMTLDMLKKLNKDKGLTIVIVMHDLNLASEYCDRLIMLESGSIFAQGSPGEVLTYQNIEKVYKTVVVVKKNPISSKPYVLLVSGRELCRPD